MLNGEKDTAKDWVDYQEQNMFLIDFNKADIIDNNYLKELAKACNLYIVSNSQASSIELYAKELGIDLSVFKSVYSNKYTADNASKKEIYKEILNKENVSPYCTLVVGDNDTSDLSPARELNINVKLVKDCKFSLNEFNINTTPLKNGNSQLLSMEQTLEK